MLIAQTCFVSGFAIWSCWGVFAFSLACDRFGRFQVAEFIHICLGLLILSCVLVVAGIAVFSRVSRLPALPLCGHYLVRMIAAGAIAVFCITPFIRHINSSPSDVTMWWILLVFSLGIPFGALWWRLKLLTEIARLNDPTVAEQPKRFVARLFRMIFSDPIALTFAVVGVALMAFSLYSGINPFCGAPVRGWIRGHPVCMGLLCNATIPAMLPGLLIAFLSPGSYLVVTLLCQFLLYAIAGKIVSRILRTTFLVANWK